VLFRSDRAVAEVAACYDVGEEPPQAVPLVLDVLR
jgi:hypothetical protein